MYMRVRTAITVRASANRDSLGSSTEPLSVPYSTSHASRNRANSH